MQQGSRHETLHAAERRLSQARRVRRCLRVLRPTGAASAGLRLARSRLKTKAYTKAPFKRCILCVVSLKKCVGKEGLKVNALVVHDNDGSHARVPHERPFSVGWRRCAITLHCVQGCGK
ncbi:hypothetical protein EMVG_00248 [Emiliania huxleyi virus PS401]|nr:hypothetical protein EMVG_00248 [Emiliania huxleyi virus PS401]